MASNFLLYGSYGYTGSLIARLAAGRGLRPTLAGRDKNKLAAQAAELGLEVSIPLPGLKLRRIPGIHPAGDGGQPISRLAAWFAGGAEFPEAPDSGSAPGPTDAERAQGMSLFWGEAQDSAGKRAASRLQCPEGYTLTALTALTAVGKVLAGEVSAGFQTPSNAYGPDFILEIEGVVRSDAD